MATRKTYLRVITVTVLALAAVVWMAGQSEAIIVVDTMPAHFGPMSLSQTQALRANVVHLHGDGPASRQRSASARDKDPDHHNLSNEASAPTP